MEVKLAWVRQEELIRPSRTTGRFLAFRSSKQRSNASQEARLARLKRSFVMLGSHVRIPRTASVKISTSPMASVDMNGGYAPANSGDPLTVAS
jgi:hypothetical protein